MSGPAPAIPIPVEIGRDIERLLSQGTKTAAQLISALGISQPTLSRTIQRLPSVTTFRVAGDRTPRYALLRQLPLGLAPRQSVSRVLRTGSIEPFADVEFLAGGGTLERLAVKTHRRTRVYDGLPPYMVFAAPSGFLGRQAAQEAARTHQFPSSLKDWGDEHRVAYLFSQGLNLPGNLIFGDVSLEKEMVFRNAAPTAASERAAHYVAMASTLKAAAHGSSAGGEQPKFLGLTEGRGHVIVKFAKLGSRMAELLPMEHLALRLLGDVGVPSSPTKLLTSKGFVFLEVQRFDRVGLHGRVGTLSAGAIDDEFFGKRDTWPEFAARCEREKYLSPDEVRNIDVMAAFSELIGNNDRHFENIALLIGEDGEYAGLAPAYDILPMRYAPIGGGLDPDLVPIEPEVGTIGAKPEVWARAANAAVRFWESVQAQDLGAPVSDEMRQLAAQNLKVAREFAAPLLPAR